MQTFRYLYNPFTQIHRRGLYDIEKKHIHPSLLQTIFSIFVPLKSTSAKKTSASFLFFLLFHQEYIDNILKQENELEDMNVKEPRTEEEKENAATLLELVTVRKIQFLTTFSNKTIVLHWKCQP